jgi:hypothetical protein
MPQHPRSPTTLAGTAVLATVLATTSFTALACGYHDDVTLARGIMNWVYPDALHVVGAISTAVAERRLPLPRSDGEAPDLFGAKYRATVKSLEQFEEALRPVFQGSSPPSLALVLVESMLWTRFEADQDEPRAQVHVSGPRPGDLVLVSGEVVIREVAIGRLSIGEALRLGLIRLYGSDDRRARFLAAYRVGGPVQTAGEGP